METGAEDIYKEELKMREFLLCKYMKDDNLPCEIEEVGLTFVFMTI